MKRADKIRILKQIQKGIASVEQLLPKRLKIRITPKDCRRFINDNDVPAEEFQQALNMQLKRDSGKIKFKVTRVRSYEA